MSKKERVLTNTAARQKDEPELREILIEIFTECEGRTPSADEELGLSEAATWIKEGTVSWSQAEDGLRDGTWDPNRGARAIVSEI